MPNITKINKIIGTNTHLPMITLSINSLTSSIKKMQTKLKKQKSTIFCLKEIYLILKKKKDYLKVKGSFEALPPFQFCIEKSVFSSLVIIWEFFFYNFVEKSS